MRIEPNAVKRYHTLELAPISPMPPDTGSVRGARDAGLVRRLAVPFLNAARITLQLLAWNFLPNVRARVRCRAVLRRRCRRRDVALRVKNRVTGIAKPEPARGGCALDDTAFRFARWTFSRLADFRRRPALDARFHGPRSGDC